MNNNELPLRVLISGSKTAILVGKSGQHINKMCDTYDANIQVGRNHTYEEVVEIKCDPSSCANVCREILLRVYGNLNPEIDQLYTLLLLVPSAIVGRMIGKGHRNILRLTKKYKGSLRFSMKNAPASNECVAVLAGPMSSCLRYVVYVKSVLDQYTYKDPVVPYSPVDNKARVITQSVTQTGFTYAGLKARGFRFSDNCGRMKLPNIDGNDLEGVLTEEAEELKGMFLDETDIDNYPYYLSNSNNTIKHHYDTGADYVQTSDCYSQLQPSWNLNDITSCNPDIYDDEHLVYPYYPLDTSYSEFALTEQQPNNCSSPKYGEISKPNANSDSLNTCSNSYSSSDVSPPRQNYRLIELTNKDGDVVMSTLTPKPCNYSASDCGAKSAEQYLKASESFKTECFPKYQETVLDSPKTNQSEIRATTNISTGARSFPSTAVKQEDFNLEIMKLSSGIESIQPFKDLFEIDDLCEEAADAITEPTENEDTKEKPTDNPDTASGSPSTSYQSKTSSDIEYSDIMTTAFKPAFGQDFLDSYHSSEDEDYDELMIVTDSMSETTEESSDFTDNELLETSSDASLSTSSGFSESGSDLNCNEDKVVAEKSVSDVDIKAVVHNYDDQDNKVEPFREIPSCNESDGILDQFNYEHVSILDHKLSDSLYESEFMDVVENTSVKSDASDHKSSAVGTADENTSVKSDASDHKSSAVGTADEISSVKSDASDHKSSAVGTADENSSVEMDTYDGDDCAVDAVAEFQKSSFEFDDSIQNDRNEIAANNVRVESVDLNHDEKLLEENASAYENKSSCLTLEKNITSEPNSSESEDSFYDASSGEHNLNVASNSSDSAVEVVDGTSNSEDAEVVDDNDAVVPDSLSTVPTVPAESNQRDSPANDLTLLNYHFNVKVLPEKFSYKNANFQIRLEDQIVLEEVTASDICFRTPPITSDENCADKNLTHKFYVISEAFKAIQQSLEPKIPRVLMLCQTCEGFKCFLAENYTETRNPEVVGDSEPIVNKIESKCDPFMATKASDLTDSSDEGSKLVEIRKETSEITCPNSTNLGFRLSPQSVIGRTSDCSSDLHENSPIRNEVAILPSEMCPKTSQDKDTKLPDQPKTYFFTCTIS